MAEMSSSTPRPVVYVTMHQVRAAKAGIKIYEKLGMDVPKSMRNIAEARILRKGEQRASSETTPAGREAPTLGH